MPHWPKPLGKRPINYSLDSIKLLLNNLHNPEREIPTPIYVAGTNGKGSTISFIKNILISSGYKVHVYTSPHLIYFNERIIIANEQVSDYHLYHALEECRAKSEDINLTFFEGVTAAAMLMFSQTKADFTIIEVGMGGRLDATNVIENVLLNVITPISLDHQDYLGESLSLIAMEKACTIKQNSTCILSEQTEEVRHIIEGVTAIKHASLYRHNLEWSCKKKGTKMIFESGSEEIELPLPSLTGDHQIINAGAAIAASTILVHKHMYNITYENIVEGLQNTKWPARLEHIRSGKLIDLLPPKMFDVFLDGAHNTGGATALAQWAKQQNKDVYCIVGITKERDIKAFLTPLIPVIKFLYCVCVQSEPRAQNTEIIYSAAHELSIPSKCSESLTDTFKDIRKTGNSGVILICGSLFLASDVMQQNSY